MVFGGTKPLGNAEIPGIKRFSKRWWFAVIGGGAMFAGVSAGWAYAYLSLDDRSFVILLVVAFVVGEILAAVSTELVAPTKVTVGPGEKFAKDSELSEAAEVVSGFEDSPIGRVRVRGETWAGRRVSSQDSRLGQGDRARIVGRDGLTLLIGDRIDEP